MTAALKFTDVSKRYGVAHALEAVSFSVEPGCFFGLAGVNGAGKTTLIKCLLDLASADHGRIEIFGAASDAPRARARLAFLPERFSPPYYLNGRDFLRMMALMRGDAYAESHAQAMLERLDLDPRVLGRGVRTYSKGMTQKLGLASCFLADRDLTILDEPMSGLDPLARARVKDLLDDLKGRGRTLFFTSHALSDVEEICQQVAVLHDGRVCYLGPPADMRALSGSSSLERAFLHFISTPGAIQA